MDNKVKKRNGAIDFWKFAFSLLIIAHHSRDLIGVSEGTPFCGGAIAVEFFFLVSGFLMAASLSKYNTEEISVGRGTQKFLFHKIKGMFPEILVAWVIGFVVEHLWLEDAVSLRMLFKDFSTGILELMFLRESGLAGFQANSVTWYISAMLLAMLVLVPLFLRNRDVFLNVIAPVVTIFVLGYMCQEFSSLRGPTDWIGLCYKGFLRALAELSLGSICWVVCSKIKKYRLTRFAKWLLAIAELGGYLVVFWWSYKNLGSKVDFALLLYMAIAVTISFSGMSAISSVFHCPLVYWLGKISFALFLSHSYWRHALPRLFPQDGYWQLLPKYVIATILTSIVVYWVSKGIRKVLPEMKQRLSRLLIAA